MVPTWDLVLLVFLGASLVYGFLMGQEKVIITLLGAYVGLVVANQWATSALGFLAGQSSPVLSNEWISGNISVFTTKVILFTVTLLIIAICGGLVTHSFMSGGLIGLFIQLGYSFLSAALIASSVLQFLPEDTKNQITEGSFIVAPLIHYYSWWLVLPVLFIAVTRFLARKE